MSIHSHLPQVAALRAAVEDRFGRPVRSRADFTELADAVEAVTREHLGENTLRRLWGRMAGYDTVFTRTLDVLCRYAGFPHWEVFCAYLSSEGGRESDITAGAECVRADALCPGARVRIGWMPDRLCTLEYLGERKFRAVDALHSTLAAGDVFECSLLLKGFPLYADNLQHDGTILQRYVMGRDHGLTTLELL